ncbi:pilus assembly protein PilP [Myxococcota bacterium]|nr:pilus assembly protein PilP [Myxococcota bacterium]MBU1537432.1 pilus assembly protein PilP [Myxococcota bacterium]
MFAKYLILAIIVSVPLAMGSSCGGSDDGGGGSKSSSSSAPTSPMNINANRRPTGKKTKKPANINLFANEKLSIPPFNEAAQNIPPELFSESGKDQRDPFRNFNTSEIGGSKNNTTDTNEPKNPAEDNAIILFDQYALNELKLTGIIWSAGREKALFASPNGQPTIVLKEDRISKSRALVREITHDKVIVELRARQGQVGKMITFSLARAAGPYQIQYDKLRADQRGIRIRMNKWRSKTRRNHE